MNEFRSGGAAAPAPAVAAAAAAAAAAGTSADGSAATTTQPAASTSPAARPAPAVPDAPLLVAILRGLAPQRAVDTARILVDAGFRWIEVPLNRPGALECIGAIAGAVPPDCLVGGGTMLRADDVDRVADAGGRLMVSPNCEPDVIRRAAARGLYCAPGVMTPTECFRALDAGAHALKLFPAEVVGAGGLRALRSVLPADVPMLPVGGITPESLADWRRAGASGFGIGSPLFTPERDDADIARRAAAFIAAWQAAHAG